MRIELESTDLEPLVQRVVREVLAQLETIAPKNRLGYSEREAGELLGLPVHVIRDLRRKGEINARKVGRGWIISHAEMLRLIGERSEK